MSFIKTVEKAEKEKEKNKKCRHDLLEGTRRQMDKRDGTRYM